MSEEVTVKPASLMFSILLALFVGMLMFYISDRVIKNDEINMVYYVMDNAMMLNTLVFSPGTVMLNYNQDMAKYKLETEGFTLSIYEKSLRINILDSTKKRAYFGKDAAMPVMIRSLGKDNYYYKTGSIVFTSEERAGARGYVCPYINTTNISPSIIMNPLKEENDRADGFAYDTLNTLRMLGFWETIKPKVDITRTTTGDNIDLRNLQVRIKEKGADMLISARMVEDEYDFIAVYVPYDSVESSKIACLIINGISEEFDGLEGAAIVPSSENLIGEIDVRANIIIEFHAKDPEANQFYQNRDRVIKTVQEGITGYYEED